MPQVHRTEGLGHNQTINITRVNGARDIDAMHAFVLDLQRRVNAGELVSIKATAIDENGNTLNYDSTIE